ncbi:MAG: DUF2062 domain-containing protein [Pelagibacteraceae bacterium TMED124]|nr:hypothetical protein [Rickettsiales bacterium]RPG19351.1 MAG: DUF2062 domain-containing protein [Pelagibacteraceae bacterium TMED124]|tara:strand:+ start:5596 stop:6045 length:450 start_codon:yes stop_codon:yes gene_type:complete
MEKIFRIIKLQKYRITKIKDFPESVAIGIAWGAAVSFTPLLGFHLIICYLGTWLMRGNLIAATVGTVVGNPWTFPFIFYLDYKIGTTIYFNSIDYYEFKIKFFVVHFEDLFYPTLLGSVPLALIVWFITFNMCKKFLIKRINEKNKIRR